MTEKLRELLAYVCSVCGNDQFWGKTKLCKIMFLIDSATYTNTGETLTGFRYTNDQNGPVPYEVFGYLEELSDLGVLRFEVRRTGDYEAVRYLAQREADTDHFTPEEMAVVTSAIAELRGMTATQASEWSHQHPAWRLTKRGEPIPEALLNTGIRSVPASEREWLKEELRRKGFM